MKKEKIVIANWKMKLSISETLELAKKMKDKFVSLEESNILLAVCPNFISLLDVGKIFEDSKIKLGAQNVFWEDYGSYTGEICASMLKDASCDYVIIGHSERRKFKIESYEMIHKEIAAVLKIGGITPIVCIGENWDERKTDRRDFVLFDQLQQAFVGIDIEKGQQIIVAYEPIWAVGSGTAIEPSEAEYAHKVIKLTLNDMLGADIVNENFKIIYGGSINSENINSFIGLENIDGMLVGSASLDAEEFYKVIKAVIC
ncbi:MAG: triose-phosphate isomerase [bacterium]